MLLFRGDDVSRPIAMPTFVVRCDRLRLARRHNGLPSLRSRHTGGFSVEPGDRLSARCNTLCNSRHGGLLVNLTVTGNDHDPFRTVCLSRPCQRQCLALERNSSPANGHSSCHGPTPGGRDQRTVGAQRGCRGDRGHHIAPCQYLESERRSSACRSRRAGSGVGRLFRGARLL